MIENLIWLAAGLVLGVVYHAALHPYVVLAWDNLKAFAQKLGIGTRTDA